MSLLVGFILYFLLDVNYFLRVIFTVTFANYFRKRIKLLEPSAVYGICLPSDGDFMVTHMNNARYLRECDFGRFDSMTRTGLLGPMVRKGGNFPIAATTFRYRLPLPMFSLYKVETRVVWWDSKSLYFEHRVITLKDGIVRGIGYLRNAAVTANLEEIVSKVHPDAKKPEIPGDLQNWIKFNEMHSEKMKKNTGNGFCRSVND